jgi:hypothetical protein
VADVSHAALRLVLKQLAEAYRELAADIELGNEPLDVRKELSRLHEAVAGLAEMMVLLTGGERDEPGN